MSQSPCSPSSQKHFLRSGSCFPKDALDLMANAYNEVVSSDVAKHYMIPLKPIKSSKSKRGLWKQLSSRFFNICRNHEACWLETAVFKDKGLHGKLIKHFRPPKPMQWYANPYTWLSNFDIEKVMIQYEDAYKDFTFLGVFPIDFASPEPTSPLNKCIGEALCKLDIPKLWNERRQWGAIFNLDRHDQSGSHWVAVYCNLNPKKANFGIYYYDSNGLPPPPEIAALQHSVSEQMRRILGSTRVKRPFIVDYNSVQHQFQNTECGVYTMYFLHRCLKRIPFQVIKSHVVTDKQVHAFRNRFYRENSQYIVRQASVSNHPTIRVGGDDFENEFPSIVGTQGGKKKRQSH